MLFSPLFFSKSQGYNVICVINNLKIHFLQVLSMGTLFIFPTFSGRSAVQKLGAQVFEEVYNYLKRARQQKASEAEIRASLEKVVPRASDCFEVDQLLCFEEQLLITVGEGPTLQSQNRQMSKASTFKGTNFCENPFST